MVAIYAVYDKNGCVGRCDARCHKAVLPECTCICGGAFHGVGTQIAVEDRSTLSNEEIIETCSDMGIEGELRVRRHEEQLRLF